METESLELIAAVEAPLTVEDETVAVKVGRYEVYEPAQRAALTVFTELGRYPMVGGEELKFARKALGLTRSQFASAVALNVEVVGRWETDVESIPHVIRLAVSYLLSRPRDDSGPSD